MIQITLPDGSRREYPGPVTVADLAASIGSGLAKAALAGKVDGKVVDTTYTIPGDAKVAILTPKDAEGLDVIRHSTAKRATVQLDRDGRRLRIAVDDPGPARPGSPADSTGFGIAGMTGRAQAVGGELSAGPGASGGFEVRASLPLPETWRGTS